MTAPTPREKVLRAMAELEVLDTYDAMRCGWYDYGAGQRANELSRRRRELDWLATTALRFDRSSPACSVYEYLDELDVAVDPVALLEAFERVGRPRLRRLERESFRRGCKATDRSLACWTALEARYRAAVELADVPAAS